MARACPVAHAPSACEARSPLRGHLLARRGGGEVKVVMPVDPQIQALLDADRGCRRRIRCRSPRRGGSYEARIASGATARWRRSPSVDRRTGGPIRYGLHAFRTAFPLHGFFHGALRAVQPRHARRCAQLAAGIGCVVVSVDYASPRAQVSAGRTIASRRPLAAGTPQIFSHPTRISWRRQRRSTWPPSPRCACATRRAALRGNAALSVTIHTPGTPLYVENADGYG